MQIRNREMSQSSDIVNEHLTVGAEPLSAAPAQIILDQNAAPSGSSSFLSSFVSDKCVQNDVDHGVIS
jgi:hypothetical protein